MIKLIDIHKSFGPQQVLRGVDLEIPAGKITVILGPSGQGKSVLLKMVIGLLSPDSGKVVVDGADLGPLQKDDRQMNEFRKKFGMLFQSGALFDSLTVEGNVAFPLREHARLSPEETATRVQELLTLVGLTDAALKMPSELSGGMRKRVGLARAIALKPKIILYDEPTTGLDPLMTSSINRLILDMQERLKITSVIISHDIPSTFEVADRIAMLYEGKILAEGNPAEFKQSRHPFVRSFLKDRIDH